MHNVIITEDNVKKLAEALHLVKKINKEGIYFNHALEFSATHEGYYLWCQSFTLIDSSRVVVKNVEEEIGGNIDDLLEKLYELNECNKNLDSKE